MEFNEPRAHHWQVTVHTTAAQVLYYTHLNASTHWPYFRESNRVHVIKRRSAYAHPRGDCPCSSFDRLQLHQLYNNTETLRGITPGPGMTTTMTTTTVREGKGGVIIECAPLCNTLRV